MTGSWDAERDAYDAAQALAGLAALLSGTPGEQERHVLLSMARNGEAAAERVAAYLRQQRGAGDGDLAAVPTRLAPWRDWVPTRGHLFGATAATRHSNEVPQPRRCDPGE
ncbi:hypothetical protein [Actinoplanes aureus]|uniref:Uncharacterized protein n=1 Tax=Actinoplanes aureus TaxID=2792083 RepID=A0A931FWX4_9ACTN|nr:hypothetical protein [Actinoplanes aureus]MBG0561855.1 hypothetical protein [Actinoplanes aureus]